MKKSQLKYLIKECVKELLSESKFNHMGEKEYQDYSSWKRACKQASPNCKFDGSRDICGCQSHDGKYVGEWDGEKGSVAQQLKESDPCWKGYEQIGNKEKNGKAVPNCVPKK